MEPSTSLKAAAFLSQALDLADDPATMVDDLVTIEATAVVTIFAAELDTSAGPAAFLIYQYAIAASDDEGQTGRQRLDNDLATMETAAARDVPGPRPVAHAVTAEDGFILATSPATLRVLTGEGETEVLEATSADLLPTGNHEARRREAAEELLRLLRLADEQATAWLAATGDPAPSSSADPAPVRFAFSPEETELALFLLDDRGIQNVLHVLNRVLTTARDQAARARPRDGVT